MDYRRKLAKLDPLVQKGGATSATLEELRRRMARLIAPGGDAGVMPHQDEQLGGNAERTDSTRSANAMRSPPEPIHHLPFNRHDTQAGALYVRRVRRSQAHRVGRIHVADAAAASSHLLALFALDPEIDRCDPARALYLDLETTGLSGGAGTIAFLVGLGWIEQTPPVFVVEQLLLRQPGEEGPILARIAERAAAASMLVTFNGKAFDLPLLQTRLVMNGMPSLDPLPHLDLLHLARRLHGKRIGSCHLGRVESHVLGYERVDDIAGSEVASRYSHFLRAGDESALAAVVEHNEADVLAMGALVSLYGESLDNLAAADLAAAARTLRRARSFDLAHDFAQAAIAKGGGADALRARGEVAKARGDKARALADFESLLDGVADPRLHLELAKLYEHHAKVPSAALAVLARGTPEKPEAHARRVSRLRRKNERHST